MCSLQSFPWDYLCPIPTDGHQSVLYQPVPFLLQPYPLSSVYLQRQIVKSTSISITTSLFLESVLCRSLYRFPDQLSFKERQYTILCNCTYIIFHAINKFDCLLCLNFTVRTHWYDFTMKRKCSNLIFDKLKTMLKCFKSQKH